MKREELIKEITKLQQRLNQTLDQSTSDAWINLNLTVAQLKSLFFIDSNGVTNSRSLASALGVTPSNMTGIIDRLAKQGLVSRQENPEDRRMLLLQATDKGKDTLVNLKQSKTSHMSEVLACMGTEELSILAWGLSSLVKAVETYEK